MTYCTIAIVVRPSLKTTDRLSIVKHSTQKHNKPNTQTVRQTYTNAQTYLTIICGEMPSNHWAVIYSSSCGVCPPHHIQDTNMLYIE